MNSSLRESQILRTSYDDVMDRLNAELNKKESDKSFKELALTSSIVITS